MTCGPITKQRFGKHIPAGANAHNNRTTEKSMHMQSVHCAVLLGVQNILSADISISRQTEGHSFGDHVISESVSAMPSSVTEASTRVIPKVRSPMFKNIK
jgi:hypothetical protein